MRPHPYMKKCRTCELEETRATDVAIERAAAVHALATDSARTGSVSALALVPAELQIVPFAGERHECPCRLTGRLMDAMGLKHAALMHHNPTAVWSLGDQRIHVRDEDEHLFPKVRVVAATFIERGKYPEHGHKLNATLDALGRDHEMFEREYWSKGLRVPPEIFNAHGAVEEALVETYEGPIRYEAGLPVRGFLSKAEKAELAARARRAA